MTDPFAAYAQRATSTQPPTLLGPITRRADARTRYDELVQGLHAAPALEELEIFLLQHTREITQFQAELDLLWKGDGDFRGLEKEIEWARARVDDGLDFPRWEPADSGAFEGHYSEEGSRA